MSSFTRKKIDVTLILENNANNPDRSTFDGSANTLFLSGYRVMADIRKVGTTGDGTQATIKIYGMSQADMNKLSLLNWESAQVGKNKIIVSAGDDAFGMFDVFAGQILNAWADYSGMPEVCLTIQASPAYYWQIATAEPASYPTIVDAGLALSEIAQKMGMGFVNNGVKKILSTPYLSGSLMDQARSIVEAIGAILIIEGDTMILTDFGLALSGDEIPFISAENGLIGYPAWHQKGVSFMTLFNSALRFNGRIQLQTDIDIANGIWVVVGLAYRLESENPSGAWFCQVEAARPENAITA